MNRKGSSSTPLVLWALRLLWLLLPVAGGVGFRAALESVADTPGLIIEIGLWLVWFIGLVAVLTPHPLSLTIVRIVGPAIVGFAVIAGFRDGWGPATLASLGSGLVVSAVALLPAVGDAMVNGSAYGSERRMSLRTPAVAFLGPIPLAWAVIFAGLSGWAVLAAAERYWLALAAALIGALAVWVGGRLLHQLARRWVVFVPAGFVLHDPFQLVDPVLVARAKISRLGPAEIVADGAGAAHDEAATALDLSAGSMGLALEVESTEPLLFGVRRKGGVDTETAAKVVFSPTLPGALLSEARIRGIKIRGSAGAD